MKLVEMCRGSLKGQYYGGPLVDTAVNAVFAALIWHSQDCREELATFGKGSLVIGKGLSPTQTALSLYVYACSCYN